MNVTQSYRKFYRFREELISEISSVLSRGYYGYKILGRESYPEAYEQFPCKEGYMLVNTNAPSDAFHKMVQRAMCEKADKETGGVHITYKEDTDPVFSHDFYNKNKDRSDGVLILVGKE